MKGTRRTIIYLRGNFWKISLFSSSFGLCRRPRFSDHVAHLGSKRRRVIRNAVLDCPFDAAFVNRFTIADFINAASGNGDLITFGGPPIPVAAAMNDAAIRNAIGSLPSTPLDVGMRDTMDRFASLRDAGRLDTSDLI